MNISIIFPKLPPVLDGIGDSTKFLSSHLSQEHDVTILTSNHDCKQIDNVSIRKIFTLKKKATFSNITQYLKQNLCDWLILQYNPFSYGQWGLNLRLPLIIGQIKKEIPNIGISLIVHEPYVPLINFKFLIMGSWQRIQLWLLVKSADIIFFAIQPWKEKFKRYFPEKKIQHFQISSNVSFLQFSKSQSRNELSISDDVFVIGVFGMLRETILIEYIVESLKGLHAISKKILLIYIGPNGNKLKNKIGDIPYRNLGTLEPEKVGQAFSIMDIYISPFSSGVSSRNGSFLTALQYGVPVLSTFGKQTDNFLLSENEKSFFLTPSNSKEKFRESLINIHNNLKLRLTIGKNGQTFFNNNLTWEKSVEDFLKNLNNCSNV